MSTVTVVIPNRNYAHFLDRALQSVKAQTVKPDRVIIVDGESNDESWMVVKQFRGYEWISAKPKGQGNAKNIGIGFTTSEFIVPLDADDWIGNNFIERCLLSFEERVGVVAPDLVWPDGTEQTTLEPFDLDLFLKGNRLFCCSMFRKACWTEVNGYREEREIFEDWLFWADIVSRGWKIKALHEPLFHYCFHDDSDSNKAGESYFTRTRAAIAKLALLSPTTV